MQSQRKSSLEIVIPLPSLWLYSPSNFGRLFSFLILYTVGTTPWMGIGPSQGRYLHTEQHKQNKHTETSMPRVGFEPTTPVSEQAMTVLIYSGSAVCIASGYGLDDRGVRVFLHVVQTGSGVHTTYYPMGTGGSFPGCKAARA
jgi:hypothetical protein